jgi:hypothetical protein
MVPSDQELLNLRGPPGEVLFCLKMEKELAPKCRISLKN